MAYKQFTMDDIILIEKYFQADIKTSRIVEIMGKKQPVYDVTNFFKAGGNSREYWKHRKEKQSNCGRKRIELCVEDEAHIEHLLRQDWTPDIICGRHQLEGNKPFPLSFSTDYRRSIQRETTADEREAKSQWPQGNPWKTSLHTQYSRKTRRPSTCR